MSDLINRQSAIDAINAMFAKSLAKDKAIEAVNSVPDVQQWIPVTERLPEKAGKYLVTVTNGNVYAGTFDQYSGRFHCAAIAWMPLPEPYKEGGS